MIGIDKSTVGVPDDGVEPGGRFTYAIRVECTSLSEDCKNVTVTDTLPEEFDVDLVPGTYSWTGGPDTDPPGGTVFAGLPQYDYTYDADTREFAITVATVAAGTSASIQIGATLPADTDLADGTIVPNTATVTADDSSSAQDSVDVPVHVPVVVDVAATKDWQDGSALAQSGEASTVTLGVTNTSSGASDVTGLTLTDQTTGTPAGDPWNYFDLTGLGEVTYPEGADQVQVLYCTLPYAQVCGAWTEGAVQTGSPLTPDAGVDLGEVTGVRFVFISSTGEEIPNGATGDVAFELTLRDTERDDGTIIEPTTTRTVTNTATPSVTNPDGTTDGDPASDTFQIVPNIASIATQKQWFADADHDYVADSPPSAPGQRRWPVSATVDATNTSPFPLETVTIREPSVSDPQSGLEYMDLTEIRLRFPDAAETATVNVTCADGSLATVDVTAPPTTAVLTRPGDWTCPAGGPDDPDMAVTAVEVVYSSPPGSPAIAVNSVAGLDVHGTLNDNAVPGDSPFTNCADATAVNTGNGSTSATSTACALLTVTERQGPSGPGTKTVSQQELPEDTPVEYTLNFVNDSGTALSDFHLIDPASVTGGLTDDSQPFASVRITELTADCGPNATVYLLVPDGSGGYTRVPQDSATDADYDAARGVEVASDPLPAGTTCTVKIEVVRRDGVPDGVVIPNCYVVIAGGQPVIDGDIDASTSCGPDLVTAPPNNAASLQKFIEPGSVVTPTAGLDPQLATVKLRIASTGNTHLKSLTVTDFDDDDAGSDFFRSFDFVELKGVSFPPGADLVQVDVCTTGCADGDWLTGTPTSSNTPPLPAGAVPADIQGIRVTFTSSDPAHSGYNLTPGENFPDNGPCTEASVCFTVTPRATDRETGAAVLGTYTDTADGHGEALGDLGGGFDIPPVDADLTVTEGRAALDVNKAVVGSATLAPGQVGFFDLTVRNTGTAAIIDLEVADPLPPELEFDETAVNGGPYAIQRFDVPDGTTAPGPETFTAEQSGGRVDRLVWTFPGRFEVGSVLVIRIGVRLAAGVSAGTTAVNLMGAGSAAGDDFDCSDAPPDGIIEGDPYLPGRNCTSSAALTTLAGAAFTARKWVSGNPELGLYNTKEGVYTTLDDPACPQLERGGDSFTRYPCVALVYPGENFTFLSRLSNNGTYRAVDARMIDVLPAPGDTGVIDPSDRGTMWDVPPSLVAPPEVSAPSDGSTATETLTYSDEAEPCTADLQPPASCPADDWSATFDSEATGFEMYAEFTSPGLAPGAYIDVVWDMTSPPDLAEPADPSIAWNSFGHTELIDTPGTRTQLGASEPQKAGVGLVFGNLRVDKKVVAEPGAEVPAGDFELTYACTVTPDTGDPVVVRSGTATFGPDEPWTLTDVPANATCVVYESEDLGGDGDHPEGDPLTMVVPWNATGEAATDTITNTFPAPPTPPTPQPSGSDGTGPDAGGLPATGGTLRLPLLLGLGSLLVGLALIAVVRRRRT